MFNKIKLLPANRHWRTELIGYGRRHCGSQRGLDKLFAYTLLYSDFFGFLNVLGRIFILSSCVLQEIWPLPVLLILIRTLRDGGC